MKMVKSLLLGSAAGVVAVAGAQAADLPVKAKAVEYVKICSLYGAGFYYIPGTDICMKVGGYIRFQENFSNGGASISNGPSEGVGARNTRVDSQDWQMRTRAVATFDTRQQTQYGVLRTYLLTGFQQDTTASTAVNTPNVYITRGFIQIAGFTFGKATSAYDFFQNAAVAYNAGPMHIFNTGDLGVVVATYTAQFGGGVSASISAESGPRLPTVLAATNAFTAGTSPVGTDLGQAGTAGIGSTPDIVANLRWDGAWGGFQLAGVLHNASGGYYTAAEGSGHPGDKWGWGVEPGIRINTPMIGPGDYFQAVYSYTVGAARYATGTNTANELIWNGGSMAYGFAVDGIYGTLAGVQTSVELTTAWSAGVSYEHFWSPALQTSLYASYLKVQYDSNATAMVCQNQTAAGALNMSATAGNCSMDWSTYNIGTRTQWNVTKGLYVGLDVLYTKLKSASPTATGVFTSGVANGAHPAGTYSVADQSAWVTAFRVHRDIVP